MSKFWIDAYLVMVICYFIFAPFCLFMIWYYDTNTDRQRKKRNARNTHHEDSENGL